MRIKLFGNGKYPEINVFEVKNDTVLAGTKNVIVPFGFWCVCVCVSVCFFFVSVCAGKCQWTSAQVSCGTLQYEQFCKSAQFHVYSNHIFIFHWSLEWTNQGHALITVKIWLLWLLLLLHHFKLSQMREEKKIILNAVKEIFDRLLSAFVIYFLCGLLYVYVISVVINARNGAAVNTMSNIPANMQLSLN